MSKPVEPDDPMELNGAEIAGDVGVMFANLVEEYASIGWDESQILEIFEKPFFQSTYNLARSMPPGVLRARVREVLGRCGVVRVSSQQAEPDPEDDLSPDRDLVQIRTPSRAAKGDSR